MSTTILLVEDESAIADTVIYALQTEGFAVRWASLGGEAIEEVRSDPTIALAILDVGLPDINGFEVCKAVRRFSDLPIIFLTARSDEIDRVVGLELGGDDYVAKPFSPRELAARVKAILRRVGNGPQTETGSDDGFTHDTARARIAYRGHWLTLTRYEYLLLKTLLAQPERVYSRTQLMDHVWQEPDASLERAVDTHIKTLRAKLREVAPDHDPIVTHRGLGYSVTGPARET